MQESRVLPTREAVCRTGVRLHQLDKCSTEHPFHGLLASQLECKHCGYQVDLFPLYLAKDCRSVLQNNEYLVVYSML